MADQSADTAIQVRELFDAKAAAWPSKYAPDGRLTARLTRLTAAVSSHVPTGGKVLDLGCGTGDLAVSLAAATLQVTGCDISPEMLHRAALADPTGKVDWVQLDPGWQSLPFESETFDALVASSVLEYVDNPTAVLRECRRVLRPGGILLCTVPDPYHLIRWLEWLLALTARAPLVRAAGRRWPRLNDYLTYLRISRQRHSPRWWRLAGQRAHLLICPEPAKAAQHSPLFLLSFRRNDCAEERLWPQR